MAFWEFMGDDAIVGDTLLFCEILGSRRTSFPPVIGAGAFAFNRYATVAGRPLPTSPGVLLDATQYRPPSVPGIRGARFLREDAELSSILLNLLGGAPERWMRFLDQAIAVWGTPMVPLTASGDLVDGGNQNDYFTCGALVTWNSSTGFITTAHGLSRTASIYLQTRDSSGKLLHRSSSPAGTVAFYQYDNIIAAPGGADLALIEIASSTPHTTAVAGASSAAPADAVSIVGRRGMVADTVSGFLKWSYSPITKRSYAEMVMTGTPSAVGGDSGAAIVRSATSEVLGHVIGVDVASSYFQDIDYEMNLLKGQFPNLTL